MSLRQRIEDEPAWVLRTQPWRETSLIVELLSFRHGRLAAVAKGARRPTSQFRGALMGFQPLRVGWSGAGEVKTLVRAEWEGGQPLLSGRALLCAYHVNELILKLTAREDPCPGLFAAYARAMAGLAAGLSLSRTLRGFELTLLRELGLQPSLDTEAGSGAPLSEQARYACLPEGGVVPADALAGGEAPYSGRALLAMARGDLSHPETLVQAKRLLQDLIHHHLAGQPLHARRIFMELAES